MHITIDTEDCQKATNQMILNINEAKRLAGEANFDGAGVHIAMALLFSFIVPGGDAARSKMIAALSHIQAEKDNLTNVLSIAFGSSLLQRT